MEVLDPIAEAEAYLAGGCYSHAEDALKEAITNNPSRLDLRIKLLEVYQHSGNETAFNALADELRPALEEAGGECQRAVDAKSNGLACDETLPDDNSLLDDATASTTPAPVTTQQKKIDTDPQQAVSAEASEHLIEWERTELPTDVSNATPTPAEGEHQIDALQQCGTAPTDTLAEAFTDFLRARKTLKPRTIEGYKRAMAKAFTDWHDKPLLEISTEMVAKRHRELSADHGAAYANRAMRFLRTLYNFALPRYRKGADSLVLENPVRCL
jgi:Tfp pilus assembly protein FimV